MLIARRCCSDLASSCSWWKLGKFVFQSPKSQFSSIRFAVNFRSYHFFNFFINKSLFFRSFSSSLKIFVPKFSPCIKFPLKSVLFFGGISSWNLIPLVRITCCEERRKDAKLTSKKLFKRLRGSSLFGSKSGNELEIPWLEILRILRPEVWLFAGAVLV